MLWNINHIGLKTTVISIMNSIKNTNVRLNMETSIRSGIPFFLLHIEMEYCFTTLKEVLEKDKTLNYINDRFIIDALRYCYLCQLLQILKSADFLHKYYFC